MENLKGYGKDNNHRLTEWARFEGTSEGSYTPTSLLKQSHPRAHEEGFFPDTS